MNRRLGPTKVGPAGPDEESHGFKRLVVGRDRGWTRTSEGERLKAQRCKDLRQGIERTTGSRNK